MLTRCPACHTRFRIYLEHLYAASGQVRCGQCSHVFDARHQAVILDPPTLSLPNISGGRSRSKPKHNKLNKVLWILGSLLLVISLGIQWLWWERFSLIKQAYIDIIIVTMCQHVTCGMPEFRDLQRIEILERNLDTSKTGVAIFKLSMINTAAQSQAYPILELKLIDAETNVIGTRRFTPQEYYSNKTEISAMMLSNETAQVTLEIVNPENKAVGFQIEFW